MYSFKLIVEDFKTNLVLVEFNLSYRIDPNFVCYLTNRMSDEWCNQMLAQRFESRLKWGWWNTLKNTLKSTKYFIFIFRLELFSKKNSYVISSNARMEILICTFVIKSSFDLSLSLSPLLTLQKDRHLNRLIKFCNTIFFEQKSCIIF